MVIVVHTNARDKRATATLGHALSRGSKLRVDQTDPLTRSGRPNFTRIVREPPLRGCERQPRSSYRLNASARRGTHGCSVHAVCKRVAQEQDGLCPELNRLLLAERGFGVAPEQLRSFSCNLLGAHAWHPG